MKILIDSAAYDAIPDLSRSFVNAQTDGLLLAGWYTAIEEKASEMQEFLRAKEIAGLDVDAAAGKLAYTKMALRWVEARLVTLGYDVPFPPHNPLKREIGNLHKRINRLKQQVRDLGGDPDDSLSIVSGPMAMTGAA
ncbi:hypothetical protein [Sphingomonas parapaucimobilis]|uniref:Uncharacterized protein n=1 Tax=Sphingomonas parapaucimobilis NBRC 15100 TaxID=1219049 RepID=A0A0A1W9Q2_9SPHN|nr:hypothetical protein [Sphingomonas parapaucimobilis]GAM01887.1 hypothetical protein SP5_069_01310 [Sphingomonas parapaucimobilis NBRC 15100]